VRTYRTDTANVDELVRIVEQDFAPQVAEEPGFVSYFVLDKGDGIIASVTICDDEAAVERSNRLATEWLTGGRTGMEASPLGVIAGEVRVHQARHEDR
jgi:hypothetical protein